MGRLVTLWYAALRCRSYGASHALGKNHPKLQLGLQGPVILNKLNDELIQAIYH